MEWEPQKRGQECAETIPFSLASSIKCTGLIMWLLEMYGIGIPAKDVQNDPVRFQHLCCKNGVAGAGK